MAVTDSIDCGTREPFDIYRHPDRAEIWVVNHFKDTVTVFNETTYAQIAAIPVTGSPHSLAFATGATGINNPVQNIYAYKTKGEIVDELKDVIAFKQGYDLTISCSHPCQARMNEKTIPMNCGYCYPCIIRKASLMKICNSDQNYDYSDIFNKDFLRKEGLFRDKKYNVDDLKAVLSSINRLKSLSEKEIKALIMQTGKLSMEEVIKAYRVYVKTMEEVQELGVKSSSNNGSYIKRYMGINENE